MLSDLLISRRAVLKGVGVGAVAGVFLHNSSADAGELPAQLNGDVVRADDSGLLIMTNYSEISVRAGSECIIWKDHPAGLTDFVPGDHVVASGQWDGSTFLASQIEILGYVVEARVERRRGDALETDRGVVFISSSTKASDAFGATPRNPSEISPGMRVVAEGRIDPDSNDLIAWTIGVRH